MYVIEGKISGSSLWANLFLYELENKYWVKNMNNIRINGLHKINTYIHTCTSVLGRFVYASTVYCIPGEEDRKRSWVPIGPIGLEEINNRQGLPLLLLLPLLAELLLLPLLVKLHCCRMSLKSAAPLEQLLVSILSC